ncbi:hypothetical protein LMOSLCC2479_2437 [Listeria monocytogenes SLCC2479]|nr:hypothetical protein LMOSLCC2372_2439 [Listeria monocytogenes SLCC2372]CBY58708.1 hypothetical protein LMOSLCC2479_2437 [Listeria monocytogenes SLCC2479]
MIFIGWDVSTDSSLLAEIIIKRSLEKSTFLKPRKCSSFII